MLPICGVSVCLVLQVFRPQSLSASMRYIYSFVNLCNSTHFTRVRVNQQLPLFYQLGTSDQQKNQQSVRCTSCYFVGSQNKTKRHKESVVCVPDREGSRVFANANRAIGVQVTMYLVTVTDMSVTHFCHLLLVLNVTSVQKMYSVTTALHNLQVHQSLGIQHTL